VDKFEWEKIMTSTTEEIKELLGRMANKCLPIELTANNQEELEKMGNGQFQKEYEQLQKEYAQMYRPLVGHLTQVYLNLMSVSKEKTEFCSKLGPFNFKNGKRERSGIFVHMPSLLKSMTMPDNWQNKDTQLKATLESMAKLKVNKVYKYKKILKAQFKR
jgi:hypothetical protein